MRSWDTEKLLEHLAFYLRYLLQPHECLSLIIPIFRIKPRDLAFGKRNTQYLGLQSLWPKTTLVFCDPSFGSSSTNGRFANALSRAAMRTDLMQT